MKLFLLALRQLRNSKRFTLFFVLNLTLGLVGLMSLDAFKVGLSDYLRGRSKEILSADISVRSRTPISNDDLKAIREVMSPISEESKAYELYTMARGPLRTRLIELQVIDQKTPFYGSIVLGDGSEVSNGSTGQIHSESIAWVYPELLTQLGLEIGDEVKLGGHPVKIVNTIESDSSDVGVGGSFAPRAYISMKTFEATNLLQTGSTVRRRYFYKLNDPRADVDPIVDQLYGAIGDQGVRVNSYKTASEQTGRLLRYILDYLGLVALIGLSFAAIGVTYLFRSYIRSQLKTIAIYRCLGLSRNQVNLVYLYQISILGLLAAIPSTGLALVAMPIVSKMAGQVLDVPIMFEMEFSTAILAFLLSVGGSVLVCWPFLNVATQGSPNRLFQGDEKTSDNSSGFSGFIVLYYLILTLGYWSLSVFLSRSWITGSLFIAILVGSSFLLYLIGNQVIQWLNLFRSKRFVIHYSIRDLVRRRREVMLSFVTLSIGALLLNVIPQTERNLLAEISSPPGAELPDFFLFDIQEDQVSRFQDFVTTSSIEILDLSPMVRARLEEVNGKPFERGRASDDAFTREEQREMRFRNRGFNLSYRKDLVVGETVSDGKFVGKSHSDGPINVSIERRFADRLSLNLGDELKFDIQGVPVEGKVTSLRSVRWTTFLPNFFILFQDGVINEAPKTYLSALGSIKDKEEFQNKLIDLFPNISMVDVTRLVNRIMGLISNMKWMILFMALLSTLVGLLVVGTMAFYQAQAQRNTANLLKVLGASFEDIRNIYTLQFFLIGLGSSLLGAFLSLALTYGMSVWVFDVSWEWTGWLSLFFVLGFSFVTWLLGYIVISRVLRLTATEVFAERS